MSMLMPPESADAASVHMHGSQDDSLEGSSEASAVCVCGSPCDDDRNCVQCDRCEEYFHPECIGYTPEQVRTQAAFFCTECNQDLFRVAPSHGLHQQHQHAIKSEMPFASMSAMSASIRKQLAVNALQHEIQQQQQQFQQQQQQQLQQQDSISHEIADRSLPLGIGIEGSLAAELPDSDMDALISLSMLASGRSPSVHDPPAPRERAPPSPSFSDGAMARFRLLSVVSPSPRSPVPPSAVAAAFLSPTSPLDDNGSTSSVSLSRSIPRARSTRSHSFSNSMSTPKTPSIAPPGTPTAATSGRKKTVITKPASLKRTPRSASKTPTKLMSSITLGSSAPTMGFSPTDALGAEAMSPGHGGSWSGDQVPAALSSSVPSIMVSPLMSQSQSAPSSSGRQPRSAPRAPNSAPPHNNDEEEESLAEEGGDHKRVFHNERERQRRSTIRNLFEELRRNVPTVAPQEGTSDRQILIEAAQHIDQLDSEGRKLETMLLNLRIENLKLRLSSCSEAESSIIQEQLSSLMAGAADSSSLRGGVNGGSLSPVKKSKGGAKRQSAATGRHAARSSPLPHSPLAAGSAGGPQSELLTLLQVAEEEWGHLPHEFANLSSSAPS